MQYFLGVTVESGTELLPRQPLTSVPYAIRAARSDNVSTESQIISTVPTGTPPLQVSSTTLVPNLNADMLDGKHAGNFVLKAGDTMTGQLNLPSVNIIGSAGPITKNWWEFGVDDGVTGSGIDFHGASAPADFAARIYRPAGDNAVFQIANSGTGPIEFDVGGAQRMVITGTGNVGIGATIPVAKLDVLGDMRVRPGIYAYSRGQSVTNHMSPRCSCDNGLSVENCGLTFYSNSDQGSVCYDWYISFEGFPLPQAVDKSYTYTRQSNPSASMNVTSSGYVGIGNDAPSVPLDVQGDVKVKGGLETTVATYLYSRGDAVAGAQYPRCPCDTSTGGGIFSSGIDCSSFYTNSDLGTTCYDVYWSFSIIGGGGSSYSYPYTRSTALPSLSVDSSTGTTSMAYELTVGTNNLVVKNGNVGIGTASPGEKLEIGTGGNLLFKASTEDPGDIIFANSSGVQKGRIWTKPAAGEGIYISAGDNVSDISIDTSGVTISKDTTINGNLSLGAGKKLSFSSGNVVTYAASSSSIAVIQTTTAVHSFCALTTVSIQTGDTGTFKYCEVLPNGNGTWTLSARGGSGVTASCKIHCF